MIRGVHRHLARGSAKMPGRVAVGDDTVAAGCCGQRLVRWLRWLRGLLPVLLWTGYILAGAAIFNAVEEPAAALRQELQANMTEETNRTIVNLFRLLLDNMNDTMNTTKQDKILAELAINLKVMSDESTRTTVRWGFMNSAQFCMTVISTIGYGYLSPKTQLGRGLCIIYALIGIPLNIIVMASAGKALARRIRSAHHCLKRALIRLAFWKKKVGPQSDSSATPQKGSNGRGSRSDAGKAGRISRTDLRTLSFNRDYTDWDNWKSPNGQTGGTTAHHHRGDGASRGRDDGVASQEGVTLVDAVSDPDVPAWGFVLLVLLYTCVFAMALYAGENDWTILDSFYYIIITITTIGFGDLVSSSALSEDTGNMSYYFLSFLAIVIPVLGMIILSAGISILINQCGKKTKVIENIICGGSKTQG